MSSKTPKYIRERREKTKKIKESEIRKPAKRWLAGFSVGWKLFEGLFASLGALVPVLSLYPRFSVNAQALSDLSDPFSAPFVITNDGLLPLYDIGYAIHVKKLIDANERTFSHPGRSYVPEFFITADRYPKWKMLSGGDTATIIPHHINSPDLQFSFPLRQGELEVLVNYRYGIWPVHQTEAFQLYRHGFHRANDLGKRTAN